MLDRVPGAGVGQAVVLNRVLLLIALRYFDMTNLPGHRDWTESDALIRWELTVSVTGYNV